MRDVVEIARSSSPVYHRPVWIATTMTATSGTGNLLRHVRADVHGQVPEGTEIEPRSPKSTEFVDCFTGKNWYLNNLNQVIQSDLYIPYALVGGFLTVDLTVPQRSLWITWTIFFQVLEEFFGPRFEVTLKFPVRRDHSSLNTFPMLHQKLIHLAGTSLLHALCTSSSHLFCVFFDT